MGAMMVPVDMHGIGEVFGDVEAMVEKLGPKGTAEAFVKARTYFKEHEKDGEDDVKPMTAAEWRSILEDDALCEGEEKVLMVRKPKSQHPRRPRQTERTLLFSRGSVVGG